MPTTDPRRRPRRVARRGVRPLVAVVLVALALVVGAALVGQLRPRPSPAGCTITSGSKPDVVLDPEQAANASTIASRSAIGSMLARRLLTCSPTMNDESSRRGRSTHVLGAT
ncbi:MAG: hypothetical protein Q4P32_08425 [Micrococcales bacterium]|nr:hypothetical protein [Micrococcales bacterium]